MHCCTVLDLSNFLLFFHLWAENLSTQEKAATSFSIYLDIPSFKGRINEVSVDQRFWAPIDNSAQCFVLLLGGYINT